MDFHSANLGFRAVALYPRLYSAARIRGLRRRKIMPLLSRLSSLWRNLFRKTRKEQELT